VNALFSPAIRAIDLPELVGGDRAMAKINGLGTYSYPELLNLQKRAENAQATKEQLRGARIRNARWAGSVIGRRSALNA
jgi:hypothetical protein